MCVKNDNATEFRQYAAISLYATDEWFTNGTTTVIN